MTDNKEKISFQDIIMVLIVAFTCFSFIFYMGGVFINPDQPTKHRNDDFGLNPSSFDNYVTNYKYELDLLELCTQVSDETCDTSASIKKMISVNSLSDYLSKINFGDVVASDIVLTTKEMLAHENLKAARIFINIGDINNAAKAYIFAFNASALVVKDDKAIIELLALKKSKISQDTLLTLEKSGFFKK